MVPMQKIDASALLLLTVSLTLSACGDDTARSDAAPGDSALGDSAVGDSAVADASGDDPYRACTGDPMANDCPLAGSVCNPPNFVCSPMCDEPDLPCPMPSTGSVVAACWFGACALPCDGGATCPDGMMCNGTLPGAVCIYSD